MLLKNMAFATMGASGFIAATMMMANNDSTSEAEEAAPAMVQSAATLMSESAPPSPEEPTPAADTNKYGVAFLGGIAGTNELTTGSMEVEDFLEGRSKPLSPNRFRLDDHKFVGWADTNENARVVYRDCQVVTNVFAAGTTNTLYAMWRATPGTNNYDHVQGGDKFEMLDLSKVTIFGGSSNISNFYVTATNVIDARVSIDPVVGCWRTNATLTISKQKIGDTNEWAIVDSVTDLATKEVKVSFTTNYEYRFEVSGVPTNSYAYTVGIGAKGSQIVFNPTGGTVTNSLSKSLSFNWTEGTQYGYLPQLTSVTNFGAFLGWYKSPYQSDDGRVFESNVVEEIGCTLYARWQYATNSICFDWNLDSFGASTNVVSTNYYAIGMKLGDIPMPSPTYENWGHVGWSTNKTEMSNGWEWVTGNTIVSNSATYYGQWSKDWRLTSTDNGVIINGSNHEIGSILTIDDEILGRPVVGIGDDAFTNQTGILMIEFPSKLETIGNAAFRDCSGLMTFKLPSTLESIGNSAFQRCSSIKTVDVPSGARNIGDSAFEDCISLAKFTFETEFPNDENAEDGFLDYEIDLGTAMLKGCEDLTSVELPLGVLRLPDKIFSGCTSLKEYDNMPYTVKEIGSEAFANCTHLEYVTITEDVDAIEAGAFYKCVRLKIARFLGCEPSDVADDIFSGTKQMLKVSYLQNMCEKYAEYCGGDWPELPGKWPSDGSSGRTLTWIGDGQYPRRLVIFNHNNATTPAQSSTTRVLVHVGRVFGFAAPSDDEMSDVTWWTRPVGGRKIGRYTKVTDGMTVYAHGASEDEEEESEESETEGESRGCEVYWGEGFYSDSDAEFLYAASKFDGIVVDSDDKFAGTITINVKDGGYSKASGECQAPYSATVKWFNRKTSSTSFSGVIDAEGKMECTRSNIEFEATVTKSGINGTIEDSSDDGGSYKVLAARNRYSMSTEEAKSVVLNSLFATKGTWHVVLTTGAVTSESEIATTIEGCPSTLAITISGMGNAEIVGTLADGSKVDTTSKLIIGDGCCCLPVIVQPYGNKYGLAFVIWFTWKEDGSFSLEGEDADVSLRAITDWNASGAAIPFTAEASTEHQLSFIDNKRYEGDATFETEASSDPSPAGTVVTITNNVWKVASGAAENPARLKLTYDVATGLFTGSFTYSDESGDTKKQTAVVNGAFTDKITEEGDVYMGYGTAIIKGVGSVPVTIEPIDDNN